MNVINQRERERDYHNTYIYKCNSSFSAMLITWLLLVVVMYSMLLIPFLTIRIFSVFKATAKTNGAFSASRQTNELTKGTLPFRHLNVTS